MKLVKLERAPSLDAFVEDPVGRWIDAGMGITYAVSPSLAGTVAWGAPDAEATRTCGRISRSEASDDMYAAQMPGSRSTSLTQTPLALETAVVLESCQR